jgi:hypothetical protein
MAKQWLVKIVMQNNDKDPVLLRVTTKGKDDLDLDLVATESTAVFKGKLRKRNIQTLRHKNYSGTEDQLEAILKYVLLEGQSSLINEDEKRRLEVGASVKGKEGRRVLSITFRDRIEDITSGIGAIELCEDDTEEISLFDWAILAVDKYKSVEGELSIISNQAAEDKTTIISLQKQLADLVEAKSEHEEQLISKFVLLLNEKKAKVRDQKRLIQTSHPNQERMEDVRGPIDERRRSYTTRRGSKRSAPEADQSEDESQAFETQENTRRQEPEAEEIESDRRTTPDTTESEASDGELPIGAKKISPRKSSPQKVKKTASTPASEPQLRASASRGKSGRNTGSEASKAPEQPLDDDEETESEDDEL